MKTLRLALLVALLAGGAVAQGTSSVPAAPDVEVVDVSWRKVQPAPRFEESVTSNNSVIGEAAARRAVNQARLNGARDATVTGADPSPPLLDVPRTDPNATRLVRPGPEYVYVFTVRNTGSRVIRHLAWEHTITDPATGKTVARREYKGDVKILPGKTATLSTGAPSSPAGAAGAKQAGQRSQGKATGQMVIQKIKYEDGSVWERDSK
ncbi:MAG TPA: hypothetical protein VF668_07760 [Pyrinomonadaceae bacterium]|jgi:hypothetical protein